MDPKEIRLLSGTAIRSIRLYLKYLEGDHATRRRRRTATTSMKTETAGQEEKTPIGEE
jgi:hypothetical protein